MTLDELYDHGQKAAKHLFDVQGYVQPMWIAETKDGELFPICVELPPDKDKAAEALKDLFKEKQVVRYVSLLEAWVYESPVKDEITQDMKKLMTGEARVSDHPDRREIIQVMAEDESILKNGIYYILRPEHGKPKLSPFRDFGEAGEMQGRFVGLLPKPHSKPH